MPGLSLDMFVRADRDLEAAQYRVLSGLQEARRAFSGNIIYPHLRTLIDLHNALQVVIDNLDQMRTATPRKLKEIDLVQQALVYETMEMGSKELAFVEELIQWAIPHVRSAIDEGRTIFEFVDENLSLEEVGIIPSYVQEGYFIVPDRQGRKVHIMQYSLSIFTRAEERYRSLRTSTVKSISHGQVDPSPQSIKLQLLEEHRELPNPATYLVDTFLEFPYQETLLPVAKRKLLRHLSTTERGDC